MCANWVNKIIICPHAKNKEIHIIRIIYPCTTLRLGYNLFEGHFHSYIFFTAIWFFFFSGLFHFWMHLQGWLNVFLEPPTNAIWIFLYVLPLSFNFCHWLIILDAPLGSISNFETGITLMGVSFIFLSAASTMGLYRTIICCCAWTPFTYQISTLDIKWPHT